MGQKLRGLVAQGMSGRKSYRDAIIDLVQAADATSSTGSITATKPCTALIYAWGGGASGGANGGSSAGGGGGAAGFKRLRIGVGQTISYSVGAAGAGVAAFTQNGNSGGDTTITLPSGLVITAGGGQTNVATAGGAGGVASGFDLNRNGGAGGAGGANSGVAGDHGGAGGSGAAGAGGGGGAGFSDLGAGLPGGAGSAGSGAAPAAGGNYGGGSGVATGGSPGSAGGLGRALILLIRPR